MNRHLIKQQHGLSLLGFICILLLVVVLVIFGIKVVPVYTEYYSVVQAMESLNHQANIAEKSPGEIKSLFFRRLYVNYVDSVEPRNVLVSRSNGLHIRVKYEVRKPLVANLDIVAEFDKTVPLTGT